MVIIHRIWLFCHILMPLVLAGLAGLGAETFALQQGFPLRSNTETHAGDFAFGALVLSLFLIGMPSLMKLAQAVEKSKL